MKEWEGLIEKEFTIVLYADRKITDDKKVDAWFDTMLEASSAKCPPDIIADSRIPNDCQYVQDKIKEFLSK